MATSGPGREPGESPFHRPKHGYPRLTVMCEPGDEWWPEPPTWVGQILGPDGEPLLDVYEHREPFGFQRR